MANVFAVPGKNALHKTGVSYHPANHKLKVFFVCFRECLETSIIVSILLSMLKQTLDPVNDPETYKKLRKQVSTCPSAPNHSL